MIFYGHNSTVIKKGKINNVTCPNCNAITSMNFVIWGRYGHLYWIPFFSLGKTNILECDSCRRTFTVGEVPQAIKVKFDFAKQGAKIPFWYYSGLMLIAGVILIGIYFARVQKSLEKEYLNEPHVGDVYHFKDPTSHYYSTMKITGLDGNTLFFVVNDYETDRMSGVDEINVLDNYTNILDTLLLFEVRLLYEDGVIYKIKRSE
ncbi:MAG TPA: hypothetical protein PKW08_09540 [Flavobacteriaceae bacterium]|nr:hypothetical protein [Flavobacteriaceae bacterium]HPF11598.1 hypothetical protein [Flavobacteriaceae bacterium]HQU21816.1 hypothetical protein [Flavobacteriaceae bacterium]HQU65283.1 hypothetical protein [Flavobacteriaceae bacterium]HRW43598.1 hypothetical protein [Flavobacteriaceae bacterium]